MNIQGKEISIQAKSETVKRAIKNTAGLLVEEDIKHFYLEFRLKEGSEKYFISERSLGFNWFFTFLLFTEFRKNRKTDIGETLFLLDEPASNLHSTAQKKLLDKFESLSLESRLIYTTHSHHLINPLWLNGTYIVKNEAINYEKEFEFDSNETDIKIVIYKQFVAHKSKPTRLFPTNIGCIRASAGITGKNTSNYIDGRKFDFYILNYINDVALNKKFKGLHFYPGNGADSNDQVIRLYLAWGRDYKILLDGDNAGKKAKNRYVKVFGDIVKTNIVTFLDIDSTWTYAIENLFPKMRNL